MSPNLLHEPESTKSKFEMMGAHLVSNSVDVE